MVVVACHDCILQPNAPLTTLTLSSQENEERRQWRTLRRYRGGKEGRYSFIVRESTVKVFSSRTGFILFQLCSS